MSKRLQVMLDERDLKAIQRLSRTQHQSVSEWVRNCIKKGLQADESKSPEAKLSAILKFAKFTGPTGEIDELLEQIERGRGL